MEEEREERRGKGKKTSFPKSINKSIGKDTASFKRKLLGAWVACWRNKISCPWMNLGNRLRNIIGAGTIVEKMVRWLLLQSEKYLENRKAREEESNFEQPSTITVNLTPDGSLSKKAESSKSKKAPSAVKNWLRWCFWWSLFVINKKRRETNRIVKWIVLSLDATEITWEEQNNVVSIFTTFQDFI